MNILTIGLVAVAGGISIWGLLKAPDRLPFVPSLLLSVALLVMLLGK